MDASSMERLERLADLMAEGKATVPQHLRGNKGDCFAICLQSMQWGMNPFAVAQKTHLVNGTLGYEAQLVAAVINSSGAVKDRFKFEWFGPWEKVIGKFVIKKNAEGKEYRQPGWSLADEEGCGIKVSATLRGEMQPRVLDLLLAQARVRNSTLWADDPKQQLAYLAQKRWSRLYAPDVILGVYTADELAEPGEKFMGMVDEVAAPPPPPKTYDQAKFDANFPAWAETIRIRRKTADDYVQFLATRGEPLTEEQAARLRAVKVPPPAAEATDVVAKEKPAAEAPASTAAAAPTPEAEPAAASDGAVTFAMVADRIAKAETQEDLKDMDELIGAVANAAHRQELTALLNKRADELPPF
ncbi:recombinase RecT [Variovorax sp. PMC12]|nr:recombinase RecT [Variovorax sp. PMC12]